jgi:hypothetical protein
MQAIGNARSTVVNLHESPSWTMMCYYRLILCAPIMAILRAQRESSNVMTRPVERKPVIRRGLKVVEAGESPGCM